MSEAEETTTVEETEETETVREEEAEETEETIDIDINASLLEAMVRRTEILEKALRGEIDVSEAASSLQSVVVPLLGSKKRRKKK